LVIILSIYCYGELTTDKHHKNGGRVFLYATSDDNINIPGILKDNIINKVPGVESVIRIAGTWETPVFQTENIDPVNSDLLFVDKDFFKFFSYNVVEGDPETTLKEPMNVVITETLANKLFGQEKALGKTIKLNNNEELTVGAVIEGSGATSCLSFNSVTSMDTRKIVQPDLGEFTEWETCNFQIFLLLTKGTDPVETGKTIFNIVPTDHQELFKYAKLIPLKKIYFSKVKLFGDQYITTGNKNKVMLLLIVAVLILIIALVNFVNISSSQWLERIKQTGVLKILGAKKSSIILNILSESFVFFLAALFISINLVDAIKPFLTEYTGIQYSQKLTTSIGFIIISLSIVFVLSIVFSIIPALAVSSSKVIYNLKNAIKPGRSRSSFNGVFVTMQFSIAIVLIAFTTLIQKQVEFGSTNMGFNQENIIGVKLTPQLNQKKEVLKKLLQGKPSISEVSFTQFYPGKFISEWENEMNLNGEKKRFRFNVFSADAEFFKMMGLKLVMGRFYKDDLSSDNKKVVVNETFLKEHNLINPIGSKIIRDFEIIGVVKDFHFKSVNQPIVPLAITNQSYASYCLVKLRTVNFKSFNSAIHDVKTTTSEISPSFPVEISIFDQAVENMYQSELRFRRTFSLFSGGAIVICCLGILAMSLFNIQRRIKEIGIRRVNGANTSEIMVLLNINFIKWVSIAFIIACPIAWYAMNEWLQNFAYKTEISWWIFGLSGITAFGIALFTVSWQSFRAANRNPVEALRYE
jgi:putative ABC transport system permease protein